MSDPITVEKDQKPVMHDYPKHGARTSCCDRDRNDLPLGEGMTTRAADVTCDGTYTPAVLAHEVYPHPSDHPDKPPTLADAAKYHAARALALYNDDINHPGYMERLILALTERTVAWHVAALCCGLSWQEALDWVHWHDLDDSNEMLYDLCKELGVELGRIKPYPLREREVTAAPEPHPCGHLRRVPGCGGCDPGAVEFVITDDGERRPFDPALDMNTVDPFSRVADFSLECETLRVVKFEPAPADSDGDQS